MANIELPDGFHPTEAVWHMRPEQGMASMAYADANWQHSILKTREREAARMRVAQLNGCETCRNWRIEGFDKVGCDEEFYAHIAAGKTDPRYSRREQLAIELAERFSLSWDSIEPEFMEELRGNFSDDEIVDLLLCIGQYVAQGRLMHILGVDLVCPIAPASKARAVA